MAIDVKQELEDIYRFIGRELSELEMNAVAYRLHVLRFYDGIIRQDEVSKLHEKMRRAQEAQATGGMDYGDMVEKDKLN